MPDTHVVPEALAPGLYRVPFAIGTKPMAMYIIAGDTLTLIDTGLFNTPEVIYLPAIRAIGRAPDDVRLVVITHADADHIGGNHAVRALFPAAVLACHELDMRWISDPGAITRERYDGFQEFGLRYSPDVFDMLASWMGPPEPVDLLITGGEGIRRTGDEWLAVHHVPGHTPGHICLHNPTHRYAIVGDAIFGLSQVDTGSGWSAPPPYTSVAAYLHTIDTIASLDIDLLLTCHYPVMRGDRIRQFIDESRAFVTHAGALVRHMLDESEAPVTLAAAIDTGDATLGPFGFARDLQFALRAHFDHEVDLGRARRITRDGVVAWEASESLVHPSLK